MCVWEREREIEREREGRREREHERDSWRERAGESWRERLGEQRETDREWQREKGSAAEGESARENEQDREHARIQKFSSGGGGVQVYLTKKALTTFSYFFLVLSLFYRSQMVNFKENYHFSGGPTFSRGVQLFQGGGGSNCLFPIETHITCDFPGGGPDPLSPPLDPHLEREQTVEECRKERVGQVT